MDSYSLLSKYWKLFILCNVWRPSKASWSLFVSASRSPLAGALHYSLRPAAQLWPAHTYVAATSACFLQPQGEMSGRETTAGVSTPTKQIWNHIHSVHCIDLSPCGVVYRPVLFFISLVSALSRRFLSRCAANKVACRAFVLTFVNFCTSAASIQGLEVVCHLWNSFSVWGEMMVVCVFVDYAALHSFSVILSV